MTRWPHRVPALAGGAADRRAAAFEHPGIPAGWAEGVVSSLKTLRTGCLKT
jgi:hypothetical protein